MSAATEQALPYVTRAKYELNMAVGVVNTLDVNDAGAFYTALEQVKEALRNLDVAFLAYNRERQAEQFAKYHNTEWERKS